jgi:A1 cistron-splicing factor AAR2
MILARVCQARKEIVGSLILTANREVSAAELHIQKKGLPGFEDRLQPYDLSSSRGPASQAVDNATAADEWQQLTSCMKGALLTKITGHEWNHWHVSSTHDIKPADIATRSDEVLEFIFPKADRTFSMASRGRVSLFPLQFFCLFGSPGLHLAALIFNH